MQVEQREIPCASGTQPRKFKVYEKAGTLRISVQDPAEAGQVVKNVQAAKEAMEIVVG